VKAVLAPRSCLLAAFFPLSAVCQGTGSGGSPSALSRYDLTEPAARFELPARLDEISGLALSADGRLFGHDDERATVYEIDLRTGAAGKRFSLGDPPLRGDFEGLAIAGERFFLVTSTGLLLEFREVEDRGEAPYRVTDTGLGGTCEIEGLDHDAVDDVLLVACKASTPERGQIVVHGLPLDPDRPRPRPIEIERAQLAAFGVRTDFAPSAIAVTPAGTLLLASAVVEGLVEVDRTGRVIWAQPLARRTHRQPEGLAFTREGLLVVADERDDGHAHLTGYATSAVRSR
jgi:uncharacterized protein YjiK